MSSDIAIKVENLSKCYQIYDAPHERLKQFILPKVQSILGLQRKHYFKEFWALKDVSFEVKKGETVGIIGRNGSGKSTLLQMICGTLNPTSGGIKTNGRIAALLELGSGFNPEFTGRENVYFNASVLGLNKEQIDARFNEIERFADIGEFVDQPVKTYSSGMLLRLAFAVIAHVDADILIIDEALAVGDVFFTQKCMRFLNNFIQDGTILFVSHDTAATISLCNSALLLDGGKIKLSGSPKNVTEQYLAERYESRGGEVFEGLISPDLVVSAEHQDFIDMRRQFISSSSLRNDIEVFKFSSEANSFGNKGALIEQVFIQNEHDQPLLWIVGGEFAKVVIVCLANAEIKTPIVGFFINDRLGQNLFGENTCISYPPGSLAVSKGQRFIAQFLFRMPILPPGDYTVTVAVAEGTQQDHIQHHWIHDALAIRSHTSSVSTGLVGIPMLNINLSIYE